MNGSHSDGGGGHVLRFNRTERAVHWSFAAAFLVLLGTGLVLAVPSWSVAVGHRAVVRQVHIVSGLTLLGVPAAIALAGNRRSIAADWRAVDRFDRDDVRFLLGRPSRAGRFNGGQKLNTIAVLGAALVLLATGVVMWQWPHFPRTWRQGSIAVHQSLTVLLVPLVAGHLYLSLLHPPTRHSLRGMVTGRVERDWAAAHHPGWDAESR